MAIVIRLFRNRNFILIFAIVFGFAIGEWGAVWTESLILPALALIMTLSTATITSRDIVSLKRMPGTILSSLLLNYLIMGGITILLAMWLVDDYDLWAGLIILAAVPPAVAVVPFSYMLGANTVFSLAGLITTYLSALLITPAVILLFLNVGFLNPLTLLSTLGQLIVIPLVASRILIVTGLTRHISKWRGTVVNWSFFIVVFTIVGLNRQAFFGDFAILLKITIIAIITTFILGYIIELVAKLRHIDQATTISLILMGTKKNYGLASVIAFTLLSERAAIPGAIFLVFAILHTVWLGLHFKKPS